MMSLMSNERELEVLTGYRFQRRVVGVGGRQESTVYAGGTVPLESTRGGVQASPSLYLGAATGYASRLALRLGRRRRAALHRTGTATSSEPGASPASSMASGPSRCASRRPSRMRSPFVEATAEDREADRVAGVRQPTAARSVFVGPTTLILYKPPPSRVVCCFRPINGWTSGRSKERLRVAVNVSYFFWLK